MSAWGVRLSRLGDPEARQGPGRSSAAAWPSLAVTALLGAVAIRSFTSSRPSFSQGGAGLRQRCVSRGVLAEVLAEVC